MNYNFCILGHGKYPEGILSALKLLAGTADGITIFNLDESTTHEAFQESVDKFLTTTERVVCFADMTGGAPHQTAARLILEKKKQHQYIVSSAPINLILDLYMQCQSGLLTDDTIELNIKKSINQAQALIQVIPTNDELVENSGIENNEEFDGGI
ncbi:PTS fructose transporter subunit IIA [Loigolactobacillus coryniformis]|uniref:PTS sugar transporter subunit IIA domain-containing protein n=1 Tax=Loigolactobacillus coryniformis TaxID=1610 RepID=UPI001C601ACB|nr:PTS fructose transporter subunit IIA [Loigolactobacillus coryniformis]MBW4803746.1 PTS fructose transporter subunit IIA [Loigolactobacillus coryniformis subsp. torquens]MBW4806447.1 PTS fructose transporter subunit IIA [Loigolactobacillus coryniformis subsp. torquens]